MIALASDCMLFKMSGGESVALSPGMISVKVTGAHADMFDDEFVRHAANAVFHYFKHELGRQSVTVGEFASALEKVLRGFTAGPARGDSGSISACLAESDLNRLASESGEGCELFFFPLLREELRQQLQHQPRVLHFRGLRPCVMKLARARRWTPRCRSLEEQVVGYLRECLTAEARQAELALVVR